MPSPALVAARYEFAATATTLAAAADGGGGGAGAALSGRRMLADPRFAIPVAAGACATPLKAAMSLLAIVGQRAGPSTPWSYGAA